MFNEEYVEAVRIVFVLSGLGAGGAEKVVNLIAHHRRKSGDEVHIVAVNATDARSYFPYDPAIRVLPLGARAERTPGFLKTGSRLFRLRQHLRVIKPDLIVSFLTKINILVRIATYGLDIPLVMSERNNFRSQQMNPLWRLARPIAARGAGQLVMQTRDACSFLPAHLRAKAAVIPNPVALPHPLVRKPSDGSRIVAVGRLENQKGFDLLLLAFKLALKAAPAATLTIFGDGPMRGMLEKQARELGIADRVQMPGITRAPVDWIAAGDIFVLSSRFEGFPNVLLEAMMAGLATIAFDCPWGPSEILDGPDTGMLVPLGNVRQLGDAMQRLVTDAPLRQKLATTGASAASSRYAMASVLEKWDAVIDGQIRNISTR